MVCSPSQDSKNGVIDRLDLGDDSSLSLDVMETVGSSDFDLRDDPSYTEIQETVFTPICGLMSCHGETGAVGPPDLRAGFSYDSIVRMPTRRAPDINYIEPGDSSNSFIFRKMEGTQSDICIDVGFAGIACGGQMPPPFSQTPSEEA